jgi:hypothetical protein
MKEVYICFYILLFSLGCKPSYIESTKSKVKLIGEAMEDKPGAFVMVPKMGMVFIHKLDEWPEGYLGNKVEVKGKLFVYKKTEPKTTDSILIQESVGTYQVIKKAKWRLIQ